MTYLGRFEICKSASYWFKIWFFFCCSLLGLRQFIITRVAVERRRVEMSYTCKTISKQHIYLKTFTAVITLGSMAINGTDEPITLQTPCFWPDFFPFPTLNRLWRKCCLNSVSYHSKDFTQHAVILVFKFYALLFACKNLLFSCV